MCVHVHVYVLVYVRSCVCEFVWVWKPEVNLRCHSGVFYLVWRYRVCSWNLPLGQANKPSSPRIYLTCLCLPGGRITRRQHHTHGCWGLNLGCHVSAGSPLPTQLSPQTPQETTALLYASWLPQHLGKPQRITNGYVTAPSSAPRHQLTESGFWKAQVCLHLAFTTGLASCACKDFFFPLWLVLIAWFEVGFSFLFSCLEDSDRVDLRQ